MSSVEKNLNGLTNDLKKLAQASETDILKYNYGSDEFLPRLHEIKPELERFIENTEGIDTEDINQMIISITLSLYENPPDSVFLSAYNEIISNKRSKALKKVLKNVQTKSQFERKMKVTGESVAAQLYTDLTNLVDTINTMFVYNDGIVTTSEGNLYLNLGRFRVNDIPITSVITDLIQIDGLTTIRETSEWLVALNFSKADDFEFDDPSIVTFSDAIRFVQRKYFEMNTKSTFEGLAKVAGMLEPAAGVQVNAVFSKLKNAIFNTEVTY